MLICPPTTHDVVARCVPLPTEEVADLAADIALTLRVGRFSIDGACVAATPTHQPASWRASGRIAAADRPSTPVTVELLPWSPRITEIHLCARSGRIEHWGLRRRRHYFNLAHEAADSLLRHLMTTTHDYLTTARLAGLLEEDGNLAPGNTDR